VAGNLLPQPRNACRRVISERAEQIELIGHGRSIRGQNFPRHRLREETGYFTVRRPSPGVNR
jgi:hypothetical protein